MKAAEGKQYPDDFWDIGSVPTRTVLADWYKDGVRYLVLAHSGFCAYLGIPIDHPLAGFDYDSLPLECHGGLTFAGEGDGQYRPKFFYWYGWDYAHSGDYTDYRLPDDMKLKLPRITDRTEKKWTLGEVKAEAERVSWDFRQLMQLAEKIKNK